ncbi:hypothetical protein Tco_1258679, partial [Tanacetum coccineum]
MANKTVGNGVGPVHSNHQNQFVQQAILLRSGKVNITPARPQSVPTGKPKVPAPVPTGRQNRWATAVKPSAVCSWKRHKKGLYWEISYTNAEDEGIFDSGCSRSMTSNMESRIVKTLVLAVSTKVSHPQLQFGNPVSKQNSHTGFEMSTMLVKGSTSEPFAIACHIWTSSVSTQLEGIDHKYYCLVITDDYSRLMKATLLIYASNLSLRGCTCAILKGRRDDESVAINVIKLTNLQEHTKLQLTLQVHKMLIQTQNERASTKSVPSGSIQIPSGETTISTGSVPVPTGSPTDSFSDDEPTTRFPSPFDLGNNEPSLGIFSSSSYDDEFGADLNNLASTVEVSPVATKRINTIHPQSLIIGDHTSAVQT